MSLIPYTIHQTSEHYSPWDQLPAPLPSESTYLTRHFYHNTVKHLVKCFVRIMNNGLHIDLTKVEALEQTLNDQLANVTLELAKNPLILQFQALQHEQLIQSYIDEQTSKLKPVEHFRKPFKYKDLAHRSYFMYIYANRHNISQPTTLIEGTTIPKWEARTVKALSASRPILVDLLAGNLTDTNPIVQEAMTLLATHKQELYNRKYHENIANPQVDLPSFNPASSKQKQALFEMLGLESEATSKDTGLPSWDRDQIERVNKETTDDHIRHFTQCFIDHSFAAIVRNNFIEAFYNYTVDSRLHSNLRLMGAKTMRPTSNSP